MNNRLFFAVVPETVDVVVRLVRERCLEQVLKSEDRKR